MVHYWKILNSNIKLERFEFPELGNSVAYEDTFKNKEPTSTMFVPASIFQDYA